MSPVYSYRCPSGHCYDVTATIEDYENDYAKGAVCPDCESIGIRYFGNTKIFGKAKNGTGGGRKMGRKKI